MLVVKEQETRPGLPLLLKCQETGQNARLVVSRNWFDTAVMGLRLGWENGQPLAFSSKATDTYSVEVETMEEVVDDTDFPDGPDE